MKILPVFFGNLAKLILKDLANQMPMAGSTKKN
jgi:hypothetical protein